MTRMTFDPALDQAPVWSGDSQKVLFASNRSGSFTLYQKNADGSGSEQELANLGSYLFNPWDWSRDGKYILYRKGTDLGYLTWPQLLPTILIQAKSIVRCAQFSPGPLDRLRLQ